MKELILHIIPFIGSGGIIAYCLLKIRRSIKMTAKVRMSFAIRLSREWEINITLRKK